VVYLGRKSRKGRSLPSTPIAKLVNLPLNRFFPPRLRLRLLAPAIGLIVAATMIPIRLRHPSLSYIQDTFYPGDFVNNLLLYLPLGIALGGSSLRRAFLFGLCLSTGAEVLQIGYVDRIPSFADIGCNTCGAVMGYLAARVYFWATGHDLKSLRVPRPVAVVAILLAVTGTFALVYHRTRSDFSNWNPAFHLAIGNELTGDRPWDGTVSALQIYPFAMAPPQISDLAVRAATSAGANEPSELPGGGLLPPVDFTTGHGRPLLSPQQEQSLYKTLVSHSQLTLLVAMRPGNLKQIGPARVITYSQDSYERNFTLGQVLNTLTFRLRTPNSGVNGTSPALVSGPVLSLDRTSFVAVVYDGRISRLYVDGEPVSQTDLSLRRPHLPWRILSRLPGAIPVREVELIGSEMLFSGLFALGIFALGGVPQRASIRFFAGAAAGAVIGGTIWAFGVSEAALGIRILLECVAASLVIAASVETQSTT
jgi:hypothetical protein